MKLLDAVNLKSVAADPEVIKKLLKHDREFLIEYSLGDALLCPVPDFHITILDRMLTTTHPRFACAVPRDHAKTTLAKIACVWYFLFSRARFIVYLSNTFTVAMNACVDVINMIKSSNYTKIFGVPKFEMEQSSLGFYKFTWMGKTCMLKAQGAGQQIRGMNIDNQRPQIAIVDDLEDTDNIDTKEKFDKLKDWFYGTFRKAMDKMWNKIIQIGNMIAETCMLRQHCDSPYWESMRFGALLSNGKPLWPDVWSVKALSEDYNEYLLEGRGGIWFAEMMNLPMPSGRGLIKPNDIQYSPTIGPEEMQYGFITIDPAISKNSWAHSSAIAVHAWTGTHWQCADYVLATGVDPVMLFRETMELAQKWRIYTIGIESAAYQASLQYLFPHLCTMERHEGYEFVPLLAYNSKNERMSAWAGLLREGIYKVNQFDVHITDQLLRYNPLSKENVCDLIDAYAYGNQMTTNYMDLIVREIDIKPFVPPSDSYQVCNV